MAVFVGSVPVQPEIDRKREGEREEANKEMSWMKKRRQKLERRQKNEE